MSKINPQLTFGIDVRRYSSGRYDIYSKLVIASYIRNLLVNPLSVLQFPISVLTCFIVELSHGVPCHCHLRNGLAQIKHATYSVLQLKARLLWNLPGSTHVLIETHRCIST